jgi:acyl carrier protein
MDIEKNLQRFLEKTFLVEFDDKVTFSSDLFQLGYIDSYGYIELIKHLEEAYSIEISEEELLSGVLASVNELVEFVEDRMAEA